jgi:hypothetical protein
VLASLPATALAAGAAAVAWPPLAAAAATPAGSNDAVLGSLRRLQKQQRLFGDEPPQSALQQRFEVAQAQLQRIQLLLKISQEEGQYDSARMKLREGAFKTLRLDLGYAQELTRVVPQQVGVARARPLVGSPGVAGDARKQTNQGVPQASHALAAHRQPSTRADLAQSHNAAPQAVREVIEGVERLDGALKRREPVEAVEGQISRLLGQLGGMVEAVARLDDLQ